MPYASLLAATDKASLLLRAMANERRLAVLCHLCEREHSVNELCRLVGLSQSALSQHLAKLRRDKLVTTRRSAQTVYYSVASPEVGPLLRALSEIFGSPDALERERLRGAERIAQGARWGKSDI